MLLISALVILLGYVLGSFPSAYLVGRLKGRDLSVHDGDGRLGTTFALRRLGLASGLAVAFLDFSKGLTTVAAARVLDVPALTLLLAGIAAVAGHNWSIFLKFKGGRGAMVGYGVLASLAFWGLVIASVPAGIFFFFIRNSSLATVILVTTLTLILWLQRSYQFLPVMPWEPEITPWLLILPLTLLVPNFLKYLQVRGKAR